MGIGFGPHLYAQGLTAGVDIKGQTSRLLNQLLKYLTLAGKNE